MDIAPLLPPRGALIGLDLGTKTIGVATSDPDRRLATGVETIARKTFTADAQRLLALAAERKAVGFVLGLPDQHGWQRGTARAVDPRLRPQPRTPDRASDRVLGRAAVHRRRRARPDRRRCRAAQKRAAVIDQHAAAFILQGALDRLARFAQGSKPASCRRRNRMWSTAEAALPCPRPRLYDATLMNSRAPVAFARGRGTGRRAKGLRAWTA